MLLYLWVMLSQFSVMLAGVPIKALCQLSDAGRPEASTPPAVRFAVAIHVPPGAALLC